MAETESTPSQVRVLNEIQSRLRTLNKATRDYLENCASFATRCMVVPGRPDFAAAVDDLHDLEAPQSTISVVERLQTALEALEAPGTAPAALPALQAEFDAAREALRQTAQAYATRRVVKDIVRALLEADLDRGSLVPEALAGGEEKATDGYRYLSSLLRSTLAKRGVPELVLFEAVRRELERLGYELPWEPEHDPNGQNYVGDILREWESAVMVERITGDDAKYKNGVHGDGVCGHTAWCWRGEMPEARAEHEANTGPSDKITRKQAFAIYNMITGTMPDDSRKDEFRVCGVYTRSRALGRGFDVLSKRPAKQRRSAPQEGEPCDHCGDRSGKLVTFNALDTHERSKFCRKCYIEAVKDDRVSLD